MRGGAADYSGDLQRHPLPSLERQRAPRDSERINVAFDETKTFTKNVVLIISSCGGETGEMHQTISVLRDIKRTHVLTTAVVRGGNCSSACVPIFLQGSARMAALASVWLLHHAVAEVTDGDTITRRTDAAATERVIKDYFEPAGVSKRWLKKVRAKIKAGDTGKPGATCGKARAACSRRSFRTSKSATTISKSSTSCRQWSAGIFAGADAIRSR